MRRLKHPVLSVLLFLGAAVVVEGMSARPNAEAARAPAPVVPTLTFTETYRAVLHNTRAGGIAVETERLLINATIPYAVTDPPFTPASALHVNIGRFKFDGALGGDPQYVSGKRSARIPVSVEEYFDDLGRSRTRAYAIATLKFVPGRRGQPNRVLLKIAGVRANFQDVVGSPESDFSIVAPALWTTRLLDLEGGGGTESRALSSGFSVDSVVTLGTLSNTFVATYTGTSKPKVKTIREIVDYDPETFRPIYGPETHFLADVSLAGTGTLK